MENWIHLNKTSGSGSDSINVTCDSNSSVERSTIITVKTTSGKSIPVNISQDQVPSVMVQALGSPQFRINGYDGLDFSDSHPKLILVFTDKDSDTEYEITYSWIIIALDQFIVGQGADINVPLGKVLILDRVVLDMSDFTAGAGLVNLDPEISLEIFGDTKLELDRNLNVSLGTDEFASGSQTSWPIDKSSAGNYFSVSGSSSSVTVSGTISLDTSAMP